MGYKTCSRTLASILALVTVLAALFAVFACAPHAFADDEDDAAKDDLSFYSAASSAATYYEKTHMPNGDDDEKASDWKDGGTLNAGTAGGLLGFRDQNYNKGVFGLFSSFSSSDQSQSYDALDRNTSGNPATSKSDKAIADYARYGRALTQLNLDSTSSGLIDNIIRFIAGALMMVVYLVSALIGVLFGGVLTILSWFNPFGWLSDQAGCTGSPVSSTIESSTCSSNVFGAALQNQMGNPNHGVGSIISVVSRAYNAFSAVGWIMIPIFFAALFATIALNKISKTREQDPEMRTSTRVKRVAIRVAFLTAGIPLLGMMYGSALDYMKMNNTVTSNASYILGSNYVDFENWAFKKRLALPDGTSLTVKTSTYDPGGSIVYNSQKTTPIRVLTRKINNDLGWQALMQDNDTSGRADDKDYTDMQRKSISGEVDLLGSTESTTGVTKAQSNLKGALSTGTDLLMRYMMSSTVSGASYETDVKANLAASGKEYDQNIQRGSFATLNKDIKLMKDVDGYFIDQKDSNNHSPFEQAEAGGAFILTNGHLNSTRAGDTKPYTITYDMANGGTYGLSDMAMYNYLTTKFEPSQIIVYSSKKATSWFNSVSHHSVNQVGGNVVQQFMMYINTLVMLLAIAVIGVFYFMAIMINNIKRSFKLIMSAFTAALGSLKAIIRTIMLTLMLIIEIFGSMVLFSLVTMLIMSLGEIVDTTMGQRLMPNGGATLDGPAMMILDIFMLFVNVVMMICIIIMSIRIRKEFVQTVDASVAGIVDKVFGSPGAVGSTAKATAVPNPKGPGIGRQAMSAAAQMGGAALGAKAIDKFGDSDAGQKIKDGLSRMFGGSEPGEEHGNGGDVVPGGSDPNGGGGAGDNSKHDGVAASDRELEQAGQAALDRGGLGGSDNPKQIADGDKTSAQAQAQSGESGQAGAAGDAASTDGSGKMPDVASVNGASGANGANGTAGSATADAYGKSGSAQDAYSGYANNGASANGANGAPGQAGASTGSAGSTTNSSTNNSSTMQLASDSRAGQAGQAGQAGKGGENGSTVGKIIGDTVNNTVNGGIPDVPLPPRPDSAPAVHTAPASSNTQGSGPVHPSDQGTRVQHTHGSNAPQAPMYQPPAPTVPTQMQNNRVNLGDGAAGAAVNAAQMLEDTVMNPGKSGRSLQRNVNVNVANVTKTINDAVNKAPQHDLYGDNGYRKH